MFSIISRVLALAGAKYRARMIIGLVFRMLKSLSAAFTLLAVLYAFTHLNDMSNAVIGMSSALLGGSVIAQFIFQYLSDTFLTQSSYRLFRDKRLEISDRLKSAPMGYFSEQRLGNIQTVLTTTMGDLEANCALGLSFLVGGFSHAFLMGVMMTVFCPPVGAVVIVAVVVGILMLKNVQRYAARYTVRMQKAQEGLVGKSIEFIRGIAVVRSFGGSSRLSEVERAFSEKFSVDLACTNGTALPMKLYDAVFKVAAACMFGVTALLAVTGGIEMSLCLMLLVASFLVFLEIELMGDGAFLSKLLATQLDRLETVFDIPCMAGERRDVPEPLDIALEHVGFSYGEQPVLRDVSLAIPAGSTCAVVGPSGSGKTTLVNLIARFWDVDAGRVSIGGADVRDIDPDTLLARVSMVFQNVYLFNETVAANIAFGMPEASREDIEQAARRARCHDFIQALPQGFDTVIGEGGSTLSGGERQRVSIARAILKDAPIVILDEATSSVDPENERALIDALAELTYGKTLISIAHRLATVRTADQIVVLDDGGIAQSGTHDQLAAQPGPYARFLAARAQAESWKLGKEVA